MGFFGKSKSSAPARPAPQHHAPPQQGGGMMSGLGGALATGMAVGTGAAVGREAANYMMGSGNHRVGQPQQ